MPSFRSEDILAWIKCYLRSESERKAKIWGQSQQTNYIASRRYPLINAEANNIEINIKTCLINE